jgi:hypothetical protein
MFWFFYILKLNVYVLLSYLLFPVRWLYVLLLTLKNDNIVQNVILSVTFCNTLLLPSDLLVLELNDPVIFSR